jgi:hypothetical protein
MAQRFKRFTPHLRMGADLNVCAAIAVGDMLKVDGTLRIQVKIDHPDDASRDISDDSAAAG